MEGQTAVTINIFKLEDVKNSRIDDVIPVSKIYIYIHQKLHDIGSPEFPIKLNSQFLVLAVDGIETPFFAIYKLEDVKNSQIVDVTPAWKIDVRM